MDAEHCEHYRLYLQTNRSFIEQKFMEMFKVELQEEEEPQINFINQNKLEKLVRDVFSFEGNSELKRFYADLSINIAKFCQQSKPLNGATIMEMMLYCLDMAFKEEQQQKKQEEEEEGEENQEQQEPQKEEPPQQEPIKVDVGDVLSKTIANYEELLQNPNLSRDERFVLQSSLTNMRLQQATVRGIPTRHRKAQSVLELPHSDDIQDPEMPRPPAPTKRDILLKRLRPLFKFACREQQTTGANTTFDRINKECSVMTLGKFLIFCNILKVPSEKLTRFVLIEKFKKNAEGFHDINFDKFVELLDLLNKIDDTLYGRIVVEDSPTMKGKLKSVRTPFAIHDKEYFREVKLPGTARKELTSHSGQLSYSLRQELNSRKALKSQRQRYGDPFAAEVGLMMNNSSFHGEALPLEMMQASRLSQSTQERTIFTIEQLKGVANEIELKRLSRLIVHDSEDDEFMKSYRVDEFKNRRNSNIISNIRKRASEISRLEHEKDLKQRLEDSPVGKARLK